MGFDKCIVSFNQYYNIIQNSFTVLKKIPCASPDSPWQSLYHSVGVSRTSHLKMCLCGKQIVSSWRQLWPTYMAGTTCTQHLLFLSSCNDCLKPQGAWRHPPVALAQDVLHTSILLSIAEPPPHVGSLNLSCMRASHRHVSIKFDYFFFLICFMSIWSLDWQEKPWACSSHILPNL